MLRVTKTSARKVQIWAVLVLCVFGPGNSAVAQTFQQKDTNSGSGTIPAQAEQPASQAPSWIVNCTNVPGGFDCRASQTLFIKDTSTRILTLVVRRSPESKKPVMLIQGPLGMYLPAGIALQIGRDAAKILPLQTCTQAGCVAEHALTDAELTAMQGGADLTVSMQDLNKKPTTFKVPGLGFTQAYAKLQ